MLWPYYDSGGGESDTGRMTHALSGTPGLGQNLPSVAGKSMELSPGPPAIAIMAENIIEGADDYA